VPDEAEELRAIERKRIEALVAGDIRTVQSLHADDYQLINPAGQELSRDDYINGIAQGFIEYKLWAPQSDIVVRTNGEMAVLRYLAQVEIAVQGEVQPVQRFWHTEVYEKLDGRWQAVWSQATRISV
jgi:ketosteroid isomerase-like protein